MTVRLSIVDNLLRSSALGDGLSRHRANRAVPMTSLVPPQRDRTEVASRYGHPWPWLIEELVEEYAVETDVGRRVLADRRGLVVQKARCMDSAARVPDGGFPGGPLTGFVVSDDGR